MTSDFKYFSLCFHCSYPTSEHKTMLAQQIVKIYPASADNTPGMKGYVSEIMKLVGGHMHVPL